MKRFGQDPLLGSQAQALRPAGQHPQHRRARHLPPDLELLEGGRLEAKLGGEPLGRPAEKIADILNGFSGNKVVHKSNAPGYPGALVEIDSFAYYVLHC
jgi:hypothetical protein